MGTDDLARFLSRYAAAPSVQEAAEATTDTQLKSLVPWIVDFIKQAPSGSIVDVGAGEGVLLTRLAELAPFRDAAGLQYVAVEKVDCHAGIFAIALGEKLHKRLELVSLAEFYAAPPAWPVPRLLVVRNVMHELDIDATARLLHWIRQHLTDRDRILIQDLQVFPEAERGNACWEPSLLQALMADLGIDATVVSEVTKSGNRWFTISATIAPGPGLLAFQDVRRRTLSRRRAQLDQWRDLGELTQGDREKRSLIGIIDFDLQRFALTEQVRESGDEPAGDQGEAARHAVCLFEQHALCLPATVTARPGASGAPPSFRDRARNQDALEDFLRSTAAATLIRGGALMGKTDLVREVLSRRAHGRLVASLDVLLSSSVWNLLEAYFAEIGAPLRMEALRRYPELGFGAVERYVEQAAAKLAPRIIVVFDHFERSLSPTGALEDSEIKAFLHILVRQPGAKIIFTSRRAPAVDFLGPGVTIDIAQPVVGRFPESKHVVNVLDDIVNRNDLHLADYPEALLEAIDQVPYLAVLTGHVLKEHGATSLNDELIDALQKRVYSELLQRIVPPSVQPLVEYLAALRGPVPKSMLIALAGEQLFAEASEAGLVYPIAGRRRDDLIGILGGLRASKLDTDQMWDETAALVTQHESDRHLRIAAEYRRVAQTDDDPRWITEVYYHTLATGDRDDVARFGAVYKQLLFASGEYWFMRRKDYARALEAFRGAQRLGVNDYQTQLRIASCLYRTQRIQEGEQRYLALIARYGRDGTKTSWIDSLLYARQFEQALHKLQLFGFEEGDSEWISGQFGRAYLGLHRYAEAARAFEKQLRMKQDLFTFMQLARAYRRMNDLANHERIVQRAIRRYPKVRIVRILHATSIARTPGRVGEAERLFRQLAVDLEGDGRVMQQLCKLLCETGRTDEARALMDSIDWRVFPKEYAKTIHAEIGIAENRWNEVIIELGTPASENDIGLLKKAYLGWAESEHETHLRREIARRGLEVDMPPEFAANIPIGILSIQLALVADNLAEVDAIITRILALNPPGAAVLRRVADGERLPAEVVD